MKRLSYHPYSLISLSVVILLFTGCTHVMKVNEFSTLQTGSPLRSVSSKTFAFKEFKDTRNADNPSLLMFTGVSWTLEQPPAVMVPILIKKELERNGHKCVTFSPQVKADFIIEGNIYRYTCDWPKPLITAYSVSTGVKIMISGIPTEWGVFMKSYVGDYTGVRSNWKPEPVESCMIKAFMSMIKEISTDLELVEFINKSATAQKATVSPVDGKILEKIEP